jgi:hypothetical protein
MLAFFTAALSVIFLRQYTIGKSQQNKLYHEDQLSKQLLHSTKILLESAEVPLTEEIIVTPVD